ncbi:MAG: PorV/PorQ family protein [Ignavibacteriae bacterium]|nr:PorV/PorQ family protein [Ignavibacteriota bacterium]
MNNEITSKNIQPMKNILILVLICSTMLVGQTKVGSTAAPFLNIAIGPRAISMGGAFVATANDATSLYWNSAGAARVSANEVMFSHTKWFADINYNWVGAMVTMGDIGTVGLNLTYIDYGDIEVTTINEQDGTGEFYSPTDIALGLSYGYNLTDRFSLGLTMKYINQNIWNSSASGFAVDVGTLFISDIYGLRIGASISNFGTEMKMSGKDLLRLYDSNPDVYGNNDRNLVSLETDYYPLPLMFRVGLAKDFMLNDMNRLTVAVDATHPNDNAESLNLGAEYSFNENVMLRAGYKSLLLENTEEGLTLGLGLKHEFSTSFIVNVNYAYQEFGILDMTQHFSVGVRF